MSVLRASMLVAGLADRETTADTREVVRRVAALEAPPSVVDRVVEAAAAAHGKPKRRRTWRVATGLAATAAAVFGARAVADLESFLLDGSSGFAFLPLLAIAFLVLAIVVPMRMRRNAEDAIREREAIAILRAIARHVPGDDALAIAAFVADVPRARLERRFDARHLAQNLAIAALTDPPASSLSPSLVSTVLVGAAAAWAVFGFWALYFLAFGQSGMAGPW